MIIDQYHGDPTYAQLHVLTRNRPLAREIIKQAEFENTDVDNLPSSAFAWEDERRFAIHTRENAAASILYRTKCGSVPDCVDQKLADAATMYDLDLSLMAGEKVAAEEAPVENYIFSDSKRLPVDTAAQIKIAEHVLTRDFERLPIEKRADAFVKLATAAKEQNVELTPLAERMAGLTVCKRAQLVDWLEARSTASDGVCREAFEKLASGLRHTPDILNDRKDLMKLASTIHTLDQRAGLEKHYDRRIPSPVETVFNSDIKIAEPMCTLGNKKVAYSKLMQLSEDVWDSLGVPELSKIAEAKEFQQVFDTLPLDLKVVLKSYV